ncbi:MAG: MbnP family protein [Bacteroidota bacterium]
MNISIKIAVALFFFIFLTSSCKKDSKIQEPEIIPNTSGKIQIQFTHSMGFDSLILNSNQYINEAGNHFEVNELMYFISDVKLHLHNGTIKLIEEQTSHYVDLSLPATLTWNIPDTISQGAIESVSFTFGLSPARNISFALVNPPESNMAWPEILGGGYHYMMLNGKWIDPNQTEQFFNFHMGIGQHYTDTETYNTNTITGFAHNNFDVTLATSGLTIYKNQTSNLSINMDLMSWFKTPHTWDFNYWGGAIMQNQRAQNIAKENGFDVFSMNSLEKGNYPYNNVNWLNSSDKHKRSILFCDFTRSLEKKSKSCCKGVKK